MVQKGALFILLEESKLDRSLSSFKRISRPYAGCM